MFLIEKSEKHDRKSGKDDVKDLEYPLFIENLARESTVKAEPELGHHK